MGSLTDYFAAATDEDAALFVDRGPAYGGLTGGDGDFSVEYRPDRKRDAVRALFRPRVRITEDGTLVVQSKDMLPDAPLGALESLLTGVPYDLVVEGSRYAATLAAHGQLSVVTVTGELQQSLATADEARLTEVAASWSDAGPAATDFLDALAHLARAATVHDERLYCWVCT